MKSSTHSVSIISANRRSSPKISYAVLPHRHSFFQVQRSRARSARQHVVCRRTGKTYFAGESLLHANFLYLEAIDRSDTPDGDDRSYDQKNNYRSHNRFFLSQSCSEKRAEFSHESCYPGIPGKTGLVLYTGVSTLSLSKQRLRLCSKQYDQPFGISSIDSPR